MYQITPQAVKLQPDCRQCRLMSNAPCLVLLSLFVSLFRLEFADKPSKHRELEA